MSGYGEARGADARVLSWQKDVLSAALDHLTLGRAALYAAILSGSSRHTCRTSLANAVSGLRHAGRQDHLPRGLLTRAWLRFLTGACTGPESAQRDLDEAWEIAERGPMKLFMADTFTARASSSANHTTLGNLPPSTSPPQKNSSTTAVIIGATRN